MTASAKLQNDVKNIIDLFFAMRNESLDLFNLYWKGGVNGEITGLASGDPACQTARLTKAQLQSGLVLVDQLANYFFDNGSVTTGDYMATCQVTLYGDATPTLLSVPVEGYADRLVTFARSCINLYNFCRNAELFYGAALFDIVDALPDGEDVVPGSDMTKNQILAAISLLQQYQKFLQNQAVTSGYYRTTLGQWSAL